MAKEIATKQYVSPGERKGVMASIKDRLDVAQRSIRREEYDRAKKCYSDAAVLYERIGDNEQAMQTRDLAAKVGRGISAYVKKEGQRVYYLGPGLASAVSVFAVALGALITIPRFTGDVVGNSGIVGSLIGVVMFITGVFGLYFSIKKDEAK